MKPSTALRTSLRDQLLRAGIIRENSAAERPLSTVDEPAKHPDQRDKKIVVPGKTNGIITKKNVWGYASNISAFAPKIVVKKVAPKETAEDGANQATPPTKNLSDDELNQLLIDNPDISAATLVNLLKQRGFLVTQNPDKAAATTEADSSSANVQVTRESAAPRLAGGFHINTNIRSHFKEASAADDGIGPTRFRVTLIQEGMGNLGNSFFYTKEALKSAVSVFEGKKIYADHPAADDEQNRPERSVRDILGHFENIRYEESESGQGELTGDVVVMPDKPYEWARALLRHSVHFAKKFPDKDFIGLSINAGGDAQEMPIEEVLRGSVGPVALKLEKAREQGITTVKRVTRINEAVSCDLVTEAGAGGKVRQMLEQSKEIEMSTKAKVKESTESAEQKQPVESQEGDAPEKKADGEGDKNANDAGHDDEASDKALIKKMLDEYVGKDEGQDDHSNEAYEAGHEAMKMAKEAGMEGDEQMKAAGYTMKMAKHMQAKQAAKEAAEGDAPAPKSDDQGSDKGGDKPCATCGGGDKPAPKEAEAKESAKMAKLIGENTALKERLAKIDFESSIDTMLRESKLPMEVTKKFRETIATVKTKADAEARFKSFREAYDLGRGGEATKESSLFLATEKTPTQTSEGEAKGFNFSDCVQS